MSKKFYLDTAIWRDYYENRSDNLRPIWEWAFAFLARSLKKKDLILYSEFVEEELLARYAPAEVTMIFEIVREKKLLEKVPIAENQAAQAAQLCKEKNVAFGDALHAILARDNQAILISRDKHFLELLDIVEVKKPEELL